MAAYLPKASYIDTFHLYQNCKITFICVCARVHIHVCGCAHKCVKYMYLHAHVYKLACACLHMYTYLHTYMLFLSHTYVHIKMLGGDVRRSEFWWILFFNWKTKHVSLIVLKIQPAGFKVFRQSIFIYFLFTSQIQVLLDFFKTSHIYVQIIIFHCIC